MPDYEKMLFNYESTNRTDFSNGEIHPIVKTVYKPKPPCYRPRPPPLKDVHTLTDRKLNNVSFSLLHKPKEIVRTDPRKIQERYEEHSDRDIEMAQKTRPRLVMTPAISMDDIASPQVRKLLIEDVYTTTSLISARTGVPLKYGVATRAAFPGTYAPAKPVTLPWLEVPFVSPQWRMESVGWDRRQLRAHTDPDKQFYLSRIPKCSACDFTAKLEDEKKLARKMINRTQ